MTEFNCPSCDSNITLTHVLFPMDREYFVKRSLHSTYKICRDYSSLFQIPSPNIDETNTFYNNNYQNYEGIKAPFISWLFKKLQISNSNPL